MLVEEITLSGSDIYIQHYRLEDIEVSDEDLDAANDADNITCAFLTSPDLPRVTHALK